MGAAQYDRGVCDVMDRGKYAGTEWQVFSGQFTEPAQSLRGD